MSCLIASLPLIITRIRVKTNELTGTLKCTQFCPRIGSKAGLVVKIHEQRINQEMKSDDEKTRKNKRRPVLHGHYAPGAQHVA